MQNNLQINHNQSHGEAILMTTNLQHFRENEISIDCDSRGKHNYKLVIVKNNKYDSSNFNNFKKEDVIVFTAHIKKLLKEKIELLFIE